MDEIEWPKDDPTKDSSFIATNKATKEQILTMKPVSYTKFGDFPDQGYLYTIGYIRKDWGGVNDIELTYEQML